MNRNIIFLALSQAVMMTTISLTLASSALVGTQLASPGLATIPLAVQYLGTMVMLYPVARFIEFFGHRFTFCGGALIGAVGLIGAAIAIKFNNFILFTATGFLIGTFGAVGQYYRFAAVDAVRPEQKNLAISLTLTGGLIAAIGGPALALWTKDALTPTFYASFLSLSGVALLGAILALGFNLPPVAKVDNQYRKRSWAEIIKKPKFIIAVLGGVLGYAVMNLLMTATPLAMLHSHFSFSETATIIQWHIVAMFAPSFFTGTLIQKTGVLTVMLLGCLLNFGGIIVNLIGNEFIHFKVALVLLGVGWNFLYVGATSLLTESILKEEASRIQAFNDTLVFLGVTIVTMLSGTLVNFLGWKIVNLYAGVPIVIVTIGLIWLLKHERKQTTY
ncbi:MFS transporter [Acinetobacter rudis]|uniref:MFS transporter n=1 Tax=Acinetobacter rudis TaxID=632955 RepID=UPI0033400EDA